MSFITGLHPKLVHFPIAFLLGGLAVEAWHMWKKNDECMPRFSNLLFMAGAATAVLAAIAGALAENAIGHDAPNHEKIHLHKYVMLSTTGVWILSLLVLRFLRKGLLAMYVVLALATIYGAALGGNLVYKYGFGVQLEGHTGMPGDSHMPYGDMHPQGMPPHETAPGTHMDSGHMP